MWLLAVIGYSISLAFLLALVFGYIHRSEMMTQLGLSGGAFFLIFSTICFYYLLLLCHAVGVIYS